LQNLDNKGVTGAKSLGFRPLQVRKAAYLEYAWTKVNSVQTQMASQEGQRAVAGLWRKLLHWISLRTHLPTIPQFTRAR